MRDEKNCLKWTVSPCVRATYTEEGAALLDIEKGKVYSLNLIGSRIWQIIASDSGDSSAEDIVAVLSSEFHISREQLAKDVGAYLEELSKNHLIEANGLAHRQKGY